jgi:hypothetical protein
VGFPNFVLDSGPSKRLNLDPDAPDDPNEEGEEMEMDDEGGMMAMMGMSGFGTTKVSALFQPRFQPNPRCQGKHIDGNQEGAVNVKKQRTWRQYMNRYDTVQLLRNRIPDPLLQQARRVQQVNAVSSSIWIFLTILQTAG